MLKNLPRVIPPARRLLELTILGLAALLASAQGPASRDAAPVSAGKRSGKPFDAKFADITVSAGVAMKAVYGGDSDKKYILEANGPGGAMVDVDGDGRLDLFIGNGRTIEADVAGATSKLFRNL